VIFQNTWISIFYGALLAMLVFNIVISTVQAKKNRKKDEKEDET
jgi:hypothetical protein